MRLVLICEKILDVPARLSDNRTKLSQTERLPVITGTPGSDPLRNLRRRPTKRRRIDQGRVLSPSAHRMHTMLRKAVSGRAPGCAATQLLHGPVSNTVACLP